MPDGKKTPQAPSAIPSSAGRGRVRRKMILAPFRGVPGLRRRVESVLVQAIRQMQAQAQAEALRDNVTSRFKANRLQTILRNWTSRFDELAEELSRRMVEDTSRAAKQHFVEKAAKAMGVPAVQVFDTPEMDGVLDDAAVAAATYVKTIPAQYLGKVAGAVAQTVRAEALPDGQSLPEYLRDLGDLTVRRSKFLARDQYAKVTSTVAEHQQRAIGVDEYVWSTSRDGRVVGNPGGMYPTGTRQHGDHYHRDGKVYRWDKPPHDGPPGTAPGCRCIAMPVIDPVKILGLPTGNRR